MATVKHAKVSAIADIGDASLVEPSDWNADHILTGTFDPTGSALSSAKVWVGSAGNVAAAVTISGDATLAASGALTIANAAVTYAKVQNVTTARLMGRATAGSGVMEEITLGTGLSYTGTTLNVTAGTGDMVLASTQTNSGAKTFLDTTFKLQNVANTFNGSFVNTNTANRIYTLKDAAGTLAFTSDITGTNSGTNTGDQTITLTGDVTGSGTGSFAATMASAQPAVHTWALAQTFTVAPVFTDASGTRTALGGTTIGQSVFTLANPSAITFPRYNADNTVTARSAANLKTDLSLVSSDVGLGNVTNNAQTQAAIVPNTVPSAGQIHVGNAGGTAFAAVTMGTDATLSSAGALTIANAAVTYAKMQNVTTARLMGRATAGSGSMEEITLGTGLSYTGTTLNSAAASATDVQVFVASGTWTKPVSFTPKTVIVVMYGPGGGGGAGASLATAVVAKGGGGGGGGAFNFKTFRASDLSATETVTIGAAGTAGAAGVAGALGGDGGAGGNTTFGTTQRLLAGGGGGGRGGAISGVNTGGGGGGGTAGVGAVGTTAAGTGGFPGTGSTSATGGGGANGGAVASAGGLAELGGAGGGGSSSTAIATASGSSMQGGGGGGTGGGHSATPAIIAGSAGGATNSYVVGGGGAVGTDGASPTKGTDGTGGDSGRAGAGGGGGGTTVTASTTGGAGGAGGANGGGGGGGGVGMNPGLGGAGGVGGAGAVYVYSYP